MDTAILVAREEAAHWEHGMVIHALAVVAIRATVRAAPEREAAAAEERPEAEAAAREAAAAHEARAAQEAIAKKEAEVRALEDALPQERARKEAHERAHADAAKQEAFETARQKVAEEKASTEAQIRDLEAKKTQLEQEREKEAASANKEAERPAAEATAAAMEGAERKIKRQTPPGASGVDTLRRLFEGHTASRMESDPDAEDSRRPRSSGRATRHRRKGQAKNPKRAQRATEKHPQDSNPFVTCSDRDGRDRQHRPESTGCKVGAARAGGKRGDGVPPGSDRGGLPPPYSTRESNPYRPAPRSGFHWGDEDSDHDMAISPSVCPSGIGH